MSEMPSQSTYPEHMEKASAGLFEHYCMHPDCKSRGAFGFNGRHGTIWLCGELKEDAADI